MVLSKKDILNRIKKEKLIFSPSLDGFQLQPHAIDLRLGLDFHIPKTWQLSKEGRKVINIDPLRADIESSFEKITLKPGQYFELMPREYIIATTLEFIELNSEDIMGVLFPRSSINRRGLAVDLSGIVDVMYKGYLMIPLMNNTQQQIIKVYPGERICSIVFQTLTTPITKEEARWHGLKEAKYHNNDIGFIGSKSDKEDEIALLREGKLDELKKMFKINLD